jgi:hypothetical protein
MLLKQLYELYHTLLESTLATTTVEKVAPIKDPNEVLIVCHLAKTKLPPSDCFHFAVQELHVQYQFQCVFDDPSRILCCLSGHKFFLNAVQDLLF